MLRGINVFIRRTMFLDLMTFETGLGSTRQGLMIVVILDFFLADDSSAPQRSRVNLAMRQIPHWSMSLMYVFSCDFTACLPAYDLYVCEVFYGHVCGVCHEQVRGVFAE